MRRRLHARFQQLHAHHQRPAHQLPVALQRPLRPVLVLRGHPVLSAWFHEARYAARQLRVLRAHPYSMALRCSALYTPYLRGRGALHRCQCTPDSWCRAAPLWRELRADIMSSFMMTSLLSAYYCAICCGVASSLSCCTVQAVRTLAISCAL